MEEERDGRQVCRVCGATIQPGDRFCPNCGSPRDASLGASSAETTPETETIPLPTVPIPPPYSPASSDIPPPRRDWGAAAPPQQPGSNRRTWWIIGGLFALFLIVCCCCAFLVLVVASSDSALQEDLEGTAAILGLVASTPAVQIRR